MVILPLQVWMDLCAKLNSHGKYIWILLYRNDVCIGVQKLFDRSQVKGFIKEYGGFAVGANIGVIGTYTEKGIVRPEGIRQKADLDGAKHQY